MITIDFDLVKILIICIYVLLQCSLTLGSVQMSYDIFVILNPFLVLRCYQLTPSLLSVFDFDILPSPSVAVTQNQVFSSAQVQ